MDCHLTYYMARHTYATEICLSNGVPIETISRMMGHSNIRTTQIYAEITNQKVRKDFGILSEKTRGRYSLPEDNMPSRVYQCGQYSGWKKECVRQRRIRILAVMCSVYKTMGDGNMDFHPLCFHCLLWLPYRFSVPIL